MLLSTTVQRIIKEVVLGMEPAKPDTEEEAAHRAKVKKNIEKIKAEGMIVDIPNEWPE